MQVLALLVAAAFLLLPIIALLVALNAISRVKGRGPGTIHGQIEDLDASLKALERQVRKLTARVAELEPKAATGPPPPKPEPEPEPEPEVVKVPAPPPVRVAPAPAPVPAPLEPPSPAPPRAFAEPLPPTRTLEERIGARWTTWVGVVAIVTSVGFFVRQVFEKNLIGYAGRVAIGLATGLAMVLSGLAIRHRKTLPYLSVGITGGGLAILYVSLFAGYNLYHLFSATTAFAAMFAVTVAGSAIAALAGQLPLAVLAVLGGLLTPILAHGERADERMLIGYLVVLDLLVLAVSRWRSWPALNRLAWTGSVLLILPALVRAPQAPHPAARLALLTALFAVFLAIPVLRAWLDRKAAEPLDLVLVVANGALYFAAVYVTLERWRPGIEGPWAFALAAAYLSVGAFHRERVADDDVAVTVHYGAAAVLVALAFPLMLDGAWVTMAWAAQAVVLVLVAPKTPQRDVALAGATLLFAAAIARAAYIDPFWYPASQRVFNVTTAVGLAVVAALAIAGHLASRLTKDGATLRAVFWCASGGLLAAILGRELHRPWDTLAWALLGVALVAASRRLPARAALAGTGAAALALASGAAILHAARLPEHAARLAVPIRNAPFGVHLAVVAALAVAGALAVAIKPLRSGFWIAAALVLAALLWTEPSGVWPGVALTVELLALALLTRHQGDDAFRVGTIVVAASGLARLYLWDAREAALAAGTLVNPWLLARVGAAIAGAYAGDTLRRAETDETAQGIGRGLLGLAWLQLLAALSLGWFLHMDHAIRNAGDGATSLRWQMQLGLSALWAVYAGVSLALGFAWSHAVLRYASLGLLGITVVKVFLIDLSEVQAVWRVLSFLVLGLVLLAVSVLYQRRLKT